MRTSRRELLKGAGAVGVGLFTPSILKAQSGVIQIGASLMMSGTQAQQGAAALEGINVALALFNKKGGIGGRPVEVVVRDDKATGVGSVAAVRELTSSGVNLIVGALQSAPALAAAPLLPDLNALMTGTASAVSLTHENFSPNFFRTGPHASMIYRGLGRLMGERVPDIGKWAAVIYDNEGGRDALKGFHGGLAATTKATLEFAPPIQTSPTAADYKVEIGQLLNSDIEGLFLCIYNASAITFLQQARSLGMTGKLKVIADGGSDLILARAMKQNLPDKIWSPGNWYPEAEPFSSDPFSKQVYEEFIAQTGNRYPVGHFNLGFRPAFGLLSAIEKADSTETEQIIKAFEGLTFQSLTGPYTIRKEDHQGYGSAVVANLVPSDAEPFYAAKEVVQYDEEVVLEPAAPGVPFKE
jgi:branched-chain amino acid transport system substrate-binding protein